MPQENKIPSSESLTELRAAMFTNGIRQLMIVNGGGAVALLAFLQAIWNTNPRLAEVVLTGIGWLLCGLFVLLPAQFIRILHSNQAEKIRKINSKSETRGKLWYAYNSLPYFSMLAFVIGVGQLVISGLSILEKAV